MTSRTALFSSYVLYSWLAWQAGLGLGLLFPSMTPEMKRIIWIVYFSGIGLTTLFVLAGAAYIFLKRKKDKSETETLDAERGDDEDAATATGSDETPDAANNGDDSGHDKSKFGSF